MADYAAVDLGATKIRSAVAMADRTIVGADRRPTPAAVSGTDVTEAVLESLKAACADAGISPDELQGVGVGTFGPLDLTRGVVLEPSNLPDTVEEIPLRDPLASLVGGGAVTLQNDTIAGLIAERTYGSHSPDDMVYLTISSGIGAGVCVDGEILHGWDGNAGEVGHLTIDPTGEMTCGCGAPGHWEGYCSGENIPRYARHVAETEGYETDIDLQTATAADVFAARGDELAEEVVDRIAHWNTIGVANIVNAYAPLVVSVGGAVALNNPERVVEPVRERLADRTVANVPEIRTTTLGDAVVLKGALASVTPERPATQESVAPD